jgi:sugar lactone lactonase YvrE
MKWDKALFVAVILVIVFGVIFFSQGRIIDPVGWEAPKAPELIGALAPGKKLDDGKFLINGELQGPEDLAFDSKGLLYAASARDGNIYRFDPKSKNPKLEVFASLGKTSSLGIKFDHEGNLIVCNDPRGLLSVSPDGKVKVLVDSFGGKPIRIPDNLDIGRDGKIYFSEASTKFDGPNISLEARYDLLEAKPYGQILVYDPKTQTTSLLIDHLYFANGVALSPAEDFLLVNETPRYRVSRYWLAGPKAGKLEVFADNLPGMPDNIKAVGDGTYWEAFVVPRMALVDELQASPGKKKFLALLPPDMLPKAEKYGFVGHLDKDGKFIETLHDPSGTVFGVTTALPHDNALYLGTLEGSFVFERPLDKPTTKSESASKEKP